MSAVTSSTKLLKQPAEVRFYTMDFTQLLSTDEIITSINSINHEVNGTGEVSDLTLGSVNIIEAGKKISVLIGGGTNMKTYRIEIAIGTSSGQILEGDGLLVIKDT